MPTIGAYEAKTHLPRLLDEVEQGASYTITKHGRPVARLVGMKGAAMHDPDVVRQAMADFRAGVGSQSISSCQAKREGRR